MGLGIGFDSRSGLCRAAFHNGPGIRAETVADILDYSVRVSSREAYVSPTRGAQGNALKTIIAMPFALGSGRGETIIEACGTEHRIVFAADQVRQEPKIEHLTAASQIVKTGLPSRFADHHQLAIVLPPCAAVYSKWPANLSFLIHT
jgi:hypothetical protein